MSVIAMMSRLMTMMLKIMTMMMVMSMLTTTTMTTTAMMTQQTTITMLRKKQFCDAGRPNSAPHATPISNWEIVRQLVIGHTREKPRHPINNKTQ